MVSIPETRLAHIFPPSSSCDGFMWLKRFTDSLNLETPSKCHNKLARPTQRSSTNTRILSATGQTGCKKPKESQWFPVPWGIRLLPYHWTTVYFEVRRLPYYYWYLLRPRSRETMSELIPSSPVVVPLFPWLGERHW